MAFPPEVIARRIHDLSEIVTVRWSGEWTKGIHYLSKKRRNSEADEVFYKQDIAHCAEYPESEWWRITAIKPVAAGDELLELEITFLNPGKAMEYGLLTGFLPNVPREVVEILRSKLNPRDNGALREVREDGSSSKSAPLRT